MNKIELKIYIEAVSIDCGDLESFSIIGIYEADGIYDKNGNIEAAGLRNGTDFKCNLEDDIGRWIKKQKEIDLTKTYHFKYCHGFKYCKMGMSKDDCADCLSHEVCKKTKDGLRFIDIIDSKKNQIPYSRDSMLTLVNSLKWNPSAITNNELLEILKVLGFVIDEKNITIPEKFQKGYLDYSKYGGICG